MFKTETYEAIIGVIAGYRPGKIVENEITLAEFSTICQKIFSSNKVKVISGIVDECRAVYPIDWGAPVGGEQCFRVTFTRNQEFDKDKTVFYLAVLDNVRRLKEYFHQSTVTLTVNDWGRISMKRFCDDHDFDKEITTDERSNS